MDLATRQHGVVATRQLAPLGYSRSSVAKAAKAGRLHRLRRGVYVVGHRRLEWQGHCMAAVLACAPAAASHSAAAYLWGLYRYEPSRVHVTAPTARHRKSWCTVHTASLSEADVTAREGIPVTSVSRTLLDQAAAVSEQSLGTLLERAEESELFDLGAVDATVARAGSHPGRGPLRRALAIYRDDPAFVRSGVEGRFRDLVRSSKLPMPAANFSVKGMELDAYWESERFAVELDVFATHGSRGAFERDRQREDDLQLLGIEVLRITDVRLEREPAAVLRRVAAHLERRRRELR